MKIKKYIYLSLIIALCLAITACSAQNSSANDNNANKPIDTENTSDNQRKIKITDANGNEIIFALNNSTASDNLYTQLPLEIDVKDYSDNEKIFYPNELSTENTPLAQNKIGTLAYYAPWKDVVMFYGGFRQNDKLFELGHVVSGGDKIPNLSGKIKIEKAD